MVKEIATQEEFNTEITSNKYVVVDCFAVWCGPCKKIAPTFVEYSNLNENKAVTFIRVDGDKVETVFTEYGVDSMPTFLFFKDGQKQDALTLIGADVNKLKENIAKLQKS